MNIAIVGDGRMGRVLGKVCAARDGVQVLGPVGRDGLDELEEIDAALDFSHPDNLDGLLKSAVRRGIPLVIGTTGFSAAQSETIRAASRCIPIVWSDNFSTGMTVFCRMARLAAQALGGTFDMEIIETHHNQKADAPSGTAKMILKAIDPENAYPRVYGRAGRTGTRGREIGVHAVRGGTAAGQHRLLFFGQMEELELRHRADSREIFAYGALKAAEFAQKAKPGLYDMEDVLFGGKGWTRTQSLKK